MRLTIGLAVLGVMAIAAPASGWQDDGERVFLLDRLLATVAGHPITRSDVRAARLLRLVPDADDTPQIVERLIDRELMRIEVDRFAVAEPGADAIDARLAAVDPKLASPRALEAAAASVSLTAAQVRAVIRDELRIAAYLQQRFGSLAADRRAAAIDEWVDSLRRRTDIAVVSGQ